MNVNRKLKRAFLIAALLLLVLAVGVWFYRPKPKPLSYDGRPPQFWLEHLPMIIFNGGAEMRFHPEDVSHRGRPAHRPDQQTVALRQTAPFAIRAFGTNLLPVLMTELVSQDSKLQDDFREFKARHNLYKPEVQLLSVYPQSYRRMCQANAAVLELGPLAEPLVPFLWIASSHTNQTINENARYLLARLDRRGVDSLVEDYARQNPEAIASGFADVRQRFQDLSKTTNFADIFPHLPWKTVVPFLKGRTNSRMTTAPGFRH